MKKRKNNIPESVLPNGIFNRIGLSGRPYPFKDKEVANLYLIMQWFNRTLNMFEWKGIDDIKMPYLEIFQQMNGYCVLLNCEGKYYLPKEVIVANPWAHNIEGFNGVHTINEDCVLLKNDSTMCGIYPIINRYTSLLVENDISLLNCDILARIVAILSVGNDKEKLEAENYISQIIDGDFSVYGSKNMFEDLGLKAQPISDISSSIMQELIEFEQYLKGALSHELGINYSFNMKREALNTAESELNNEYLIPLIQDMLQCRKQFCENARDVFGLECDVELASVWSVNEKENEAEEEILEERIDGDVTADPDEEIIEEDTPEETSDADDESEGEENDS